MSRLTSTNPRTGAVTETDIETTDAAGVAIAAERAAWAFESTAWGTRADRAVLLDALAAAIEADRDELVALADRETGLGKTRLNGELSRAAFQFRLFAEAVRDGGYLEVTIDSAGPTPIGPGPELRRMLVPIGPIAVFGSSNFPFAFSVLGGDTASALAAGNPVVVKAHSSHPLTSRRSAEVLVAAAAAVGAPDGIIGIVYGTEAGRVLVADPRIAAVGFTGSLGAGEALIEIIAGRETPIPFYGELSSLNPLVISPGAAVARAGQLAEGLFGSFTLGAGQLCTKPGIAFVPRGAGDAIVDELAARATTAEPQVLLNGRIAASLGEIRARLVADGGARLVAEGGGDAVGDGDGFHAAPVVLATEVSAFSVALAEEAFGPLIVVVVYDDPAEIGRALRMLPHSLTSTIHVEESEPELAEQLTRELLPLSGRVVFNGYPTGVRVSWAQHHGGGWPATNSLYTSVGVTAIRRFLRPVVFQDAPASVLPEELRNGYSGVPRRIDGTLLLADRS